MNNYTDLIDLGKHYHESPLWTDLEEQKYLPIGADLCTILGWCEIPTDDRGQPWEYQFDGAQLQFERSVNLAIGKDYTYGYILPLSGAKLLAVREFMFDLSLAVRRMRFLTQGKDDPISVCWQEIDRLQPKGFEK